MTLSSHPLPCDLTELQVSTLEREAALQLAGALPAWYDELGPGLDTVFLGLAGLVEAVDHAALASVAMDATEHQVRVASARSLVSQLGAPALPAERAQRPGRIAALGGAKQAASTLMYEAQTLELIAADFATCCEQVGLGGFLNALAELIQLYGQIFHAQLEQMAVGQDKVFLCSAMELRRHLGKPTDEPRDVLDVADSPREALRANA